MSGTSDLPCDTCGTSTPNTAARVAWMSVEVVSAAFVPGAAPGQATINGMWPSGLYTGMPGLPQTSRPFTSVSPR